MCPGAERRMEQLRRGRCPNRIYGFMDVPKRSRHNIRNAFLAGHLVARENARRAYIARRRRRSSRIML